MTHLSLRTASLGTIGGLSLLLAGISHDVSSANPAARVYRTSAVQRSVVSSARARSLERYSVPGPAPTSCANMNYTTASGENFNAMTSGTAHDFSDGQYSSILGGSTDEACDAFDSVGNGNGNVVGNAGNATYSFIADGYQNAIGGGASFIGSGDANEATGYGAFIGAGYENYASASGAFLGAGGTAYAFTESHVTTLGNIAGGQDSFVGAGDLNQITSGANGSFIGGGGYMYSQENPTPSTAGNQIEAYDSFIGAGDVNVVAGGESAIVAGSNNTITSAASAATILGGGENHVAGEYASVLGGFGNVASGAYAIVAGGDSDTAAGTLSFAAGYHADAAHNGSFVWSDYSSGSTAIKDTAANQFVVRASGGTTVYSNEAATSGVSLTAGSGTWASLSDRNAKTAIVPLDDDAILAKVSALPIDAWQYKSERGVRHVGPMAQDFYAAFRTGTDDRHITSIDEDGVALASIKALHRENGKLASQVAALAAKNADLERRFEALAARVR